MIQYAIGYKDEKNNHFFIKSDFSIEEQLSAKILYLNKNTAKKALDRANKTFPIRVKNLEQYKETNSAESLQWKELYWKEKATLGKLEIFEIELKIKLD